MKKQTIYGLSLIFLAVGLNSCGKTTKRKVTNDWKIVSLEDEGEMDSNNDSYSKTTMTESSVSIYNTYSFSGPDSIETFIEDLTGLVKTNNLSIKKDGTWQWNQELFYENIAGPNSQNATLKKDLSGTWSFMGKTKGNDFKKNERLVFNVLSSYNSDYQIDGQTVVNDYSEQATYLTGQNTMTFTVKESTGKELQLEMESASNFSYSWSSGVNTQRRTLKMTLKEQ